jgi:thiol-disulfide isomerase/thioredoxin
LRGSAVLINFWASWCGPCETEMPALDAVYQVRREEGLVVLAVAVDDSAENVRRFDEKHQLGFPILIDESGEASRAYLVFGLPTTVLVGRDGKITDKHTGALAQEEIETYVSRALQQE